MKKIPTIFDRNWEGNRSVIDKPTIGCEWVFDGEGTATEKINGTNIKVKIKDSLIVYIWKRKNPNKQEKAEGKEPYYVDAHREDSQDKHIFKAVNGWSSMLKQEGAYELSNGEYECEAYGGKIQGNPLECEPNLYFFKIKPKIYENVPRDYEKLKNYLSCLASHFNPTRLAEGIVFHHLDGRMAKIKRRDFKF